MERVNLETTGDQSVDGAQATVWPKILKAALALPGAKVDRDSYFRSQFGSRCPADQVDAAVNDSPAWAGISPAIIDKLADAAIRGHVVKASGISIASGLPGGWFMAATIPGDLVQYFWHSIVLAQKLAYLYGWPDLLKNGKVDEDTEWHLTLLIGAMMGAGLANEALTGLAEGLAGQVSRRLPRLALTKTMYFPIVKNVGKWIGVKVTKQSFARVVSKAVPLVGGVVSAGVTALTMSRMAKRLKKHLRCLEYARGPNMPQ